MIQGWYYENSNLLEKNERVFYKNRYLFVKIMNLHINKIHSHKKWKTFENVKKIKRKFNQI